MIYENMTTAVFLKRLNRFTAEILIDDRVCLCHVKNTGRLRELLLEGAEIFVRRESGENRKTAFSLIGVKKDGPIFNIDSTAPNTVFREWVLSGGLGHVPESIRPEVTHGDSRFDFMLQHKGKTCFAEVKGVTLVRDGAAYFPDAPTERAIKHLNGLCECVKNGMDGIAAFIVQVDGIKKVRPNPAHPDFVHALQKAAECGVRLVGINCHVTENGIYPAEEIEVEP